MPRHVPTALASKLYCLLRELARMADEIYLHSKGEDTSSFQNSLRKSLIDSKIEQLAVKMEEICQQISTLKSTSASRSGSSLRGSRNSGAWLNSNYRSTGSRFPDNYYRCGFS